MEIDVMTEQITFGEYSRYLSLFHSLSRSWPLALPAIWTDN